MPRVYLDSDEPYIVSNNNTRVFGGAGTEVIAVQAGVTGLVLDQNIERVSFPGASGDYRYQQAGNQLRVYASNNLMATVPLQGDANGSELVFSNSTVFATIGAGGAISFSAPTSTYNMKVALYSTLSVARGYDATKPLDGLPFDSLTVVVNGSPVKLPLGDKDKIDTFADLKKAVEDALWGNPATKDIRVSLGGKLLYLSDDGASRLADTLDLTLTGGTLSRAGSGWSTSAVLPPDNGFNSRIDPPSITSTSNLISSTIVLDNATSGSPAAYYPQVQKVYVACFGYPADPAGLVYWASKLSESNGDMKQIINAFGNSSEFVALYAGVNNADKVTMIYERLFNRAPDNAGLDFFTRELNEGRMTAASVALNVANGATGIDATTLSNKLSVASAFTDALATDSTAAVAYSGMFATNLARLMISQVTSLSTTVNPVQETIQAIKKGPLPAQSLNLLDHTSSLSTGHPTDEQVALLWLDSSAEVSALVIGTEASQMSDVYSSADGQASSASLIGSGIQYKEVIA